MYCLYVCRVLVGGGLMLFVNEDIPSKLLTGHTLPENVEMLSKEINLTNQKWVFICIYNPPDMHDKYFMDNLSKTIDLYNTKYDRIVVMGDFNLEPSSVHIDALCYSHYLYLVNENTCLKENLNATISC